MFKINDKDNSDTNGVVPVSLLLTLNMMPATLLKRGSNSVFLWILQNFQEHLFL